jgi:hypothetical protein
MTHQNSAEWRALLKRPSAYLPLAMSLVAVILLAVQGLRFGLVRGADEGATAHLWQLLMAGQLPIIAFFVFKWSRRNPTVALSILGLQVLAGALAMAPVFLLGL